MRAKGWMSWVIYSWGLWKNTESRRREKRTKGEIPLKIKWTQAGRQKRLEMKKSTSRRKRNPRTWWRQRKMSARRRNSIMSEWDGKRNKGRKQTVPWDRHIRKSSPLQWGFLIWSGTLIIACQLCPSSACSSQMWPDQIWWFCMKAQFMGLDLLWNPEPPENALSQPYKPWPVFSVRRG